MKKENAPLLSKFSSICDMFFFHHKKNKHLAKQSKQRCASYAHRQTRLFCQWPDHKFPGKLKLIEKVLDDDPEMITWVQSDLIGARKHQTLGAQGITAEQVLRSAIIKQMNEWTYRELAIQCADSGMTKAFIGLDFEESFGKSCLQENISKISAKTWTKINEVIVRYVADNNIESGRTVRMDATVVESNIHYPTDSTLLFDCLKVINREFDKIRKVWPNSRIYFTGSIKEAKNLVLKIVNAKNSDERKPHYRKLIKQAKKVLSRLAEVLKKMDTVDILVNNSLNSSLLQLKNVSMPLPQIIYQAEQRVLKDKKLPPEKKIVSIFEPHTDIIKKGQRARSNSVIRYFSSLVRVSWY